MSSINERIAWTRRNADGTWEHSELHFTLDRVQTLCGIGIPEPGSRPIMYSDGAVLAGPADARGICQTCQRIGAAREEVAEERSYRGR